MERTTAQYLAAVRGQPLPLPFVDVHAFDHNLQRLLQPARTAGKRVRLATKSVRCPALVERALQRADGLIDGLMTFSARETLLWAQRGAQDLLLGYPLAGAHDASLLAEANRHTLAAAMVDDVQHVQWLAAAAQAAAVTVPVWLDLDMAWRPVAGAHIGVRRSPLRTPEQVLALARVVAATPGVRVAGLMGYEAHIAGLPDEGRLGSWQNPMKRWLKTRSWPDIVVRRGETVLALQQAGLAPGGLRVNGGGSGSVDRTAQDSTVTEITIGSGLLAGHLFDGYRGLDLRPCLHVALAVTRLPAAGLVTCAGGGWVASGQAGADRLPLPVWPVGARLLELEGAGEVQTPLHLPHGVAMDIGDAVLLRPAKSGEWGEVFAGYRLLADGVLGETLATYRGLGWSAWA